MSERIPFTDAINKLSATMSEKQPCLHCEKVPDKGVSYFDEDGKRHHYCDLMCLNQDQNA